MPMPARGPETASDDAAPPLSGETAAPSLPLLAVHDLRVTFHTGNGPVQAINGVSFQLNAGEILALVGESGSGKTVSSMSLAGLLPDNATVSGEVLLDGVDLLRADAETLKQVRRQKIAYVFQDPVSSLNPARRIGSQIEEVLRVNRCMDRATAREQAIELLDHVGLPSPRRQLKAYPHELSGGMNQGVMIAMALASDPEIVVADEATSALDVSIQAQILALLQQVREEFETAIILVTHDFGVAGIANRVAVMYAGEIVESGPTLTILTDPFHPYTAALLMSAPSTGAEQDALFMIPGTLDEGREHAGTRCQFAPRCAFAFDRCWSERPRLNERAKDHSAACHLDGDEVAIWRAERASP